MSSNRSVNGAIGEHLVLAELLKRGFEAYLANGTTQLGFDIAVILDSSTKYIQVKGLGSSNTNVKVSKSSMSDRSFDYVIVAKFKTGDCKYINLPNTFYILDFDEVLKIYKNKTSTEEYSFSLCKGEYELDDHENKWCKININ